MGLSIVASRPWFFELVLKLSTLVFLENFAASTSLRYLEYVQILACPVDEIRMLSKLESEIILILK